MASTANGSLTQLASGLYVSSAHAGLHRPETASPARPSARINTAGHSDAAVIDQAIQVVKSTRVSGQSNGTGDGSAAVSKATSDYGVLGDAMSDSSIRSALLGDNTRAWQLTMLRDAAIHWFLYKRNPWVRTCVDLIAQRATADDYSIVSKTEDQTGIEALALVLNRINPSQSFNRLLRGVYRDRQINGNWYARIQYQGDTPVAIYRVDFRTIVPRPVPFGPPQLYDLYLNGRNDLRPIEIPAREILHLTLNDGGENGCGLSPMESLDGTLANDQAAVAYNTGFFQNGAKAGDIYQMDPDQGPDQVERERLYLKENFTKPSQSFEPLLLQGKTELLRDGASIRKDMEFVLLRTWNREEVAAVYSVPLSLITAQVGSLGGNGKEQDNTLFTEMVIAPEQKSVFEDVNRGLIQDRFNNQDLQLVAPKVAGVRLDLVKAAGEMLKAGATGNESRRVMRLEDQEGHDKPIYQLGAVTVIGAPGEPDSVLLTASGAMTADPVNPADMAQQAADTAATGAASKAPPKAGGSAKPKPTKGEQAARKKVSKAGHDFGSTQFNLPAAVGQQMQAFANSISDEHLGDDGREDEPHVTVKYGLTGDPHAALQALRAIAAETAPIGVRFGRTSLFAGAASGKDYDVVKVDLDSPALVALNRRISAALDTVDTFSDYQPHATIAYVRAGEGQRYDGAGFLDGTEATLDTLTHSDQDGIQTRIPLAGTRVSKADEDPENLEDAPAWLVEHLANTQAAVERWETATAERLSREVGVRAAHAR